MKNAKYAKPHPLWRGHWLLQGHDLYKLDTCNPQSTDAKYKIWLILVYRFQRRRFLMVFAIFSNGGHLGFPISLIFYKHEMPPGKNPTYEIWLKSVKVFQRRRWLKM